MPEDDLMEATDSELETTEETSENSEESQETSKDDTEQEEKAETEEPEKEEESIEKQVERLAQSKSDKSMKTYQTKINTLQKQNDELSQQLNEKVWNTGINVLFEEESESKGEEVAATNKTAREEVKKQVLQFQKDKTQIDRIKQQIGNVDLTEFLADLKVNTVEEAHNFLSFVKRDQMAREELWKVLFPEDKAKIDKVAGYVKRFEKAQDMDDFETILLNIRGELKNKTPKQFTPDSSKQEPGGFDLKNLSPKEKIERGLKLEAKRTGG